MSHFLDTSNTEVGIIFAVPEAAPQGKANPAPVGEATSHALPHTRFRAASPFPLAVSRQTRACLLGRRFQSNTHGVEPWELHLV